MQESPEAGLSVGGERFSPNMKPQFVSAMAMLFCCAIFAIVGVFAYTRYEAAQRENAAFRSQLRGGLQNQQILATRMPDQLPARGSTAPPADASPSASPGAAPQ